MICSSLKRLLRTTPPLGPERAIVNGEVTFPLDYFSGGRSMSIDKFETDFRGIRWGIASARQGELILPDTFGRFSFVPVTPTTYLVCGGEDGELSLAQILEINRLAVQSAQHYYLARDFARCPL